MLLVGAFVGLSLLIGLLGGTGPYVPFVVQRLISGSYDAATYPVRSSYLAASKIIAPPPVTVIDQSEIWITRTETRTQYEPLHTKWITMTVGPGFVTATPAVYPYLMEQDFDKPSSTLVLTLVLCLVFSLVATASIMFLHFGRGQVALELSEPPKKPRRKTMKLSLATPKTVYDSNEFSSLRQVSTSQPSSPSPHATDLDNITAQAPPNTTKKPSDLTETPKSSSPRLTDLDQTTARAPPTTVSSRSGKTPASQSWDVNNFLKTNYNMTNPLFQPEFQTKKNNLEAAQAEEMSKQQRRSAENASKVRHDRTRYVPRQQTMASLSISQRRAKHLERVESERLEALRDRRELDEDAERKTLTVELKISPSKLRAWTQNEKPSRIKVSTGPRQPVSVEAMTENETAVPAEAGPANPTSRASQIMAMHYEAAEAKLLANKANLAATQQKAKESPLSGVTEGTTAQRSGADPSTSKALGANVETSHETKTAHPSSSRGSDPTPLSAYQSYLKKRDEEERAVIDNDSSSDSSDSDDESNDPVSLPSKPASGDEGRGQSAVRPLSPPTSSAWVKHDKELQDDLLALATDDDPAPDSEDAAVPDDAAVPEGTILAEDATVPEDAVVPEPRQTVAQSADSQQGLQQSTAGPAPLEDQEGPPPAKEQISAQSQENTGLGDASLALADTSVPHQEAATPPQPQQTIAPSTANADLNRTAATESQQGVHQPADAATPTGPQQGTLSTGADANQSVSAAPSQDVPVMRKRKMDNEVEEECDPTDTSARITRQPKSRRVQHVVSSRVDSGKTEDHQRTDAPAPPNPATTNTSSIIQQAPPAWQSQVANDQVADEDVMDTDDRPQPQSQLQTQFQQQMTLSDAAQNVESNPDAMDVQPDGDIENDNTAMDGVVTTPSTQQQQPMPPLRAEPQFPTTASLVRLVANSDSYTPFLQPTQKASFIPAVQSSSIARPPVASPAFGQTTQLGQSTTNSVWSTLKSSGMQSGTPGPSNLLAPAPGPLPHPTPAQFVAPRQSFQYSTPGPSYAQASAPGPSNHNREPSPPPAPVNNQLVNQPKAKKSSGSNANLVPKFCNGTVFNTEKMSIGERQQVLDMTLHGFLAQWPVDGLQDIAQKRFKDAESLQATRINMRNVWGIGK